MHAFLESVKNFLVTIAVIIFIGLVLYGTIVIGLVVLTAGLIVGIIAWTVFYWKFKHTLKSYQNREEEEGKNLYYYEAEYEEIKEVKQDETRNL
jgi:hypothetical protein